MTTYNSSKQMILKLVSAALILALATPALAQDPPAAAPAQTPRGPELVDKPWSLPEADQKEVERSILPSEQAILEKMEAENASSPYSFAWVVGGSTLSYLSAVSALFSTLRQYPALKNLEEHLNKMESLMTPEKLRETVAGLRAEKTKLQALVAVGEQTAPAVPPINSDGGIISAIPGLNGQGANQLGRLSARRAAERLAANKAKLERVTRDLERLEQAFRTGKTAYNAEQLAHLVEEKKKLVAQATAQGIDTAESAAEKDFLIVTSQEFKNTLVADAKAQLRALRWQRIGQALRSWNFRSKVWKYEEKTIVQTAGVETEKINLIELAERGGQKALWAGRYISVGLRIVVVYEGLKIVYDWFDQAPLPRLRAGGRAAETPEPPVVSDKR